MLQNKKYAPIADSRQPIAYRLTRERVPAYRLSPIVLIPQSSVLILICEG